MNEVGSLEIRGPRGFKFQALSFDGVKKVVTVGLLNLEALISSIRPQVHATLSTWQLREEETPVNSPWGVGLGVAD